MKIEEMMQAVISATPQKRRTIEAVLSGKKTIPSPIRETDLRLVSLSDAARILGVSRYTIYRLIDMKQITTRRIGGIIRVPMSSLENLSNGMDK